MCIRDRSSAAQSQSMDRSSPSLEDAEVPIEIDANLEAPEEYEKAEEDIHTASDDGMDLDEGAMDVNEDEIAMSAAVLELVKEKVRKIEAESDLLKQLNDVDVVEFCRPQVESEAAKWGLKTGDVMDLKNGWDFTLKRHRDAALEYIKRSRPLLVIGSPDCTMFSVLSLIHI